MKHLLILPLLAVSIYTSCQDIDFARTIVDTLASSHFWGRGYTKDGMKRAADFIASQFKAYGVTPMHDKRYFQEFSYPVNTFPGKMGLTINGKVLLPGIDFIVSPESKGIKATGNLVAKDSVTFINEENKCIVQLSDKLTWSVAPQVSDYTLFTVDKKSLCQQPAQFTANVENKLINKFRAANVAGMVKGITDPDSFILITAHYDHLGGMGAETYFPGANDNASGVSLLLNLARYYAAHPPRYTIGFIAFAGEEAGLTDSKYFTEHPLVPLSNIRFLINTDLAGTGDEGITVVNATEFSKEFGYLNAVNDEGRFLAKIYPRGKAANSDHYFFTEKGVPAFFFYTMGGIKAYHDVFDKAQTLPLNEHEDVFKLLVKFNAKLMGE